MKRSMDNHNKMTFGSSDVVRFYSNLKEIQKPEYTILQLLLPELQNKKMLDIGVGGGRTTVYFAELVNEYIGIDYSKKMIEVCGKRFFGTHYNNFKVCDVRFMSCFEDDYFDFILFSFNGIDYISHEDRIKSLKEIKRIARKGAYFCFSSHNIQSIDDMFAFKFSQNPLIFLRKAIKYIMLRIFNESHKELSRKDYDIINDGLHHFRCRNYYIKPAFQIRQLNELGFVDVRIYSLDDGQEVKNSLDRIKDSWLYYLSKVDK